jgi:superfamily II DNA helicase RecQ
MATCVDILRGSKTQKIVLEGYNTLPMHGMMSHMKKSDVERIFHFLTTKNIIKEYYVANAMGFTSAYVQVCHFDVAWPRLQTMPTR